MSENTISGTLTKNAALVVAGVYDRIIEASLERVWENVYDWEHLPYLHSEAFTSIECVDSGDWGWRARVAMSGGAHANIELIANRAETTGAMDAMDGTGHYVARTLDGAGAPSEIWTSLASLGETRTAIHVEFCVEPIPEEALANLGRGFKGLYTKLWDQDEKMMQTRTVALADHQESFAITPEKLLLGPIEALRPRLPMVFELGGHSFRLVELEGELVTHSTQCAHLLGPLGECEVSKGAIICPWHGYEFDIRTGKSRRTPNGRSYRLRPAPKIDIDPTSGEVVLFQD